MRDAAEEAIRAGEHAAALMAEPALRDAMAALEADYLAVWRGSQLHDVAGREEAFRMLKTLDAFRAELESRIVGAQIARENIEARERARLVGEMTP